MADEDEIDILGDFSFDSCLAQNNQGIPSCSNREDTVHPQWLLDSTETNNWYDKQSKDSLQSLRNFSGPSRKLLGDHTLRKLNSEPHTVWSQAERTTLAQEMAKYGRNIEKISQTLKSKTESEIQAIIDAECGVILETTSYELDKFEDNADIPSVGQEEVVADYSQIKKVVISPARATKHSFRKKKFNPKSKNSLLKSDLGSDKAELPESTEIFYEDDMTIGSTESIGSELDMTDIVSKSIAKQQAKVKTDKKSGNHKRKISKTYEKGPRYKDLLKSPQGRQRKDSSLSDDSVKSPKMQILLGSGQALPVSEGEQVIKIEKKKDTEPESDIEIDVDSDNEGNVSKTKAKPEVKPAEEPIAVPLRKFEPMPRRQKKINLDGGGGFTIMHTEAGDLYEVGSEPRRERQPRKQPIHLIRCKVYNDEKPAPYDVHLHVSTLILMDAHAHSSRGEVMGLAGGTADGRRLAVSGYQPAAAAAGRTHCDMEPVSQAAAAERLSREGLRVVGWHHSHPGFPCAPSLQDLRSQRALQQALQWRVPPLGLITSQHWPPGRSASQYCCLRVEEEDSAGEPVGYRLPVRLVRDMTAGSLPRLLAALSAVLCGPAPGGLCGQPPGGLCGPAPGGLCGPAPGGLCGQPPRADPLRVRAGTDRCPRAGLTYLDKFISSISHHMRSAGYADDDPIVQQLIEGVRDIFR